MPDLVLVDSVNTNPYNDSNPQLGKLCTLIEWHLQDTVDDFERTRNNAIYEYQGNRNPFIDYPEWVDTIYEGKCGDIKVPDQASTSESNGGSFSFFGVLSLLGIALVRRKAK